MSKSACLCGSFRFFEKMLEIKQYLVEKGVVCYVPSPFEFRDKMQPCYFDEKWDSLTHKDKLRFSRDAEEDYLQKIEKADVLYVVNPSGYVGASVLFEIGYAIAKGKIIYSLEPIEEYAVMGLIKQTITPRVLAKILAGNCLPC